jgi:hypothetical protein
MGRAGGSELRGRKRACAACTEHSDQQNLCYHFDDATVTVVTLASSVPTPDYVCEIVGGKI